LEKKQVWSLSNISKDMVLLMFVLLVIMISVYAFRQGTGDILSFIQLNEQFSIVISLVLYIILGATPIPSEPLTILLTAMYGPLQAIIIGTIGNTFAALLEFFIGSRVGDLAGFEKRKASLPFNLGKLPIHSPVFLLLGRMLPGFGPKFISLACGFYKVPMFTYLWTTIISNLAGAALIALSGYGLMNWF
jgi:uncharacterized membrane protein YdjX (TVP38/TMEM64 family)